MQSGSLYSDVWSWIFFEAGFIPIWWYSWSNGTFLGGNLELLSDDKKVELKPGKDLARTGREKGEDDLSPHPYWLP